MAYGIQVFSPAGETRLDSSAGDLITRYTWSTTTTQQPASYISGWSTTIDTGGDNNASNCGIMVNALTFGYPVEAFFSSGSIITIRQMQQNGYSFWPGTAQCEIILFRYK